MLINRDIIAGVLISGLGLSIAIYADVNYDLGSFRRMGPGMFPFGLGLLLTGLGALVAAPAIFQGGVGFEVRPRTAIFVLAGVAAFALTIDRFGLLPAIAALTVVASFSESILRPLTVLALCVFLAGLAFLIFRLGLNLPIELIRWP